MSRFYSQIAASMEPYVPGEQPRDNVYIKLNTNECPYPPAPGVAAVLRDFASGDLRRYPDPDAAAFTAKLAEVHGLRPEQALACGGSDEALGFAFMAFCDPGDKVYFPDVTYGFYKVYADLFRLEAVRIPLREDYTIDLSQYRGVDGTVFLANPNAPTGIVIPTKEIETVLAANPDRLVVVDEAYGDFAIGCSCIPLIDKYDNLLVVRTFSKSYALAGMRLGAAFGNRELIASLNRIKYSFNPYNLDRVSMAVGMAALEDRAYLDGLVSKIAATRSRITEQLRSMGFTVLPSSTNFVFIRHSSLHGRELYDRLRQKNILVRYFQKPRTEEFVRLTIGTDDEMDAFVNAVEELS